MCVLGFISCKPARMQVRRRQLPRSAVTRTLHLSYNHGDDCFPFVSLALAVSFFLPRCLPPSSRYDRLELSACLCSIMHRLRYNLRGVTLLFSATIRRDGSHYQHLRRLSVRIQARITAPRYIALYMQNTPRGSLVNFSFTKNCSLRVSQVSLNVKLNRGV